MMNLKNLFFFLVCLLSFCDIQSQNHKIKQYNRISQNELKKLLKKGDLALEDFKYSKAIIFYESFVSSVSRASSVVLSKLSECYWQKKDYENAFRVFMLLYPHGNIAAPKQDRIRIAELYARKREYNLASKWLSGLVGYEAKSKSFNDVSEIMSMKNDSLNWHLGLLDINTAYHEFSPFVVDSILYFSSDRPDRNRDNVFEGTENNYARLWKVTTGEIEIRPIKIIDSFQSKSDSKIGSQFGNENADTLFFNRDVSSFLEKLYEAGETSKLTTLVTGFDKIRYNVGAVAFDKNRHCYFSANYPKSDKTRVNRLRLMEGYFNNRGSLKIKALPFGDRESSSVMHPAINRTGTLLVFSSDKNNGKGGYDLYYTQRKNYKEPWDSVKAFSSALNTVGNEVFPTITSNGYLYFSSDALVGLGGLDIYRIHLQDALKGISKPEHLSYPINSAADDFGWTQDSTGINGYFSSDRLNANNDLYSFYYKVPIKMYSVEDKVIDVETSKPLADVTLFLYNKADSKVYISKTDSLGKYVFNVPDADKGVIVRALRKGYSSFCLPINANVVSKTKKIIPKAEQYFALEKLKINYAWNLGNIYYDFGKADLTDEAKPVLDSLISILNIYPISVEISSHTDSRGSTGYNERLSQRRSESVVNYIVEHGISSTRLIARGYGESRLVNRCLDGVPCIEEEHQANRRTEVKITDFDVEQKSPIEEIDPDKFKQDDVLNPKALPVDFFNECSEEIGKGDPK